MAKYFRKNIRRRRARGAVRRRRPQVSTKIRRYVKRAISRNIENKRYVTYGTGQSIFMPTANAAPYNIYALPTLTQGTGAAANRIGDRVKLKRGNMKLSFYMKNYNVTTNPNPVYYLNVALVRTLAHNDGFSTTDWQDFFFAGSSSVSWQNTALDNILPINTNRFQVMYRKSVLVGTNNPGPWSNSAQSGFPVGNDVHEHLRLSIPLMRGKTKKILKFDDSISPNQASNNNLYCLIWAAPTENSTGSTSIIPFTASYSIMWEYEDA